ncbi:glycoside hydrolase [Pelobium manganitolerans]|uniref:Glycoside hydrolase n=1 Tax=Pelobium manganitolerans TaxID=1842495 RepID=A0A419S590_9SPHI|nr:glycoside hydrolase family 2 TIM barrel-domain containing protein [Pelobium manganitolerans]RKD15237.1 glycoside hydrolase [Pelobium manganitolerans]
MKKAYLILFFVSALTQAFSQRISKDFNADWKFYLGDDSTLRYEIKDLQKLQEVQLPHDWSILGDFSEKHPTTSQQGALPAGMGWYAKTFDVPVSQKGQKIYIEFDGVYRNATVYVNGKKIGFWPYGYTSYRYDLSDDLKYGQQNYIAVRVDNSEQPSSRWYTGSGIYRNVRLVSTNPIAVDHWGTFVRSEKITKKSANVLLDVSLRNDAPVAEKAKVVSAIIDASGKMVAQAVNYLNLDNSLKTTTQKFKVSQPQLWSPEHPYLYTVKTQVFIGAKQVDAYDTPLGIRSFSFDAKKGFFFNGQPMKILGVCMHHDLGAIGAVVNESAIKRQLRILKEMGTNAIRISHNPPSTEFLKACDEMGFLVMDEAFDMWRKKKNKFDYHQEFDEWHERDLKAMVLRDRNHPSIFMWSVGNEIREQFDESGTKIIKQLVDIVKKYDPTRPVTTAMTEMEADKNFIAKANNMDIYGFNYKHKLYPTLPGAFPGKSFLATETASALETRGVYVQPQDTVQLWPATSKNKYMENLNGNWTVTAYDNVAAYWGTTHEESWLAVKNKPYMAGLFVWSGFDYLGEPHPFNYPARSSYYGIVDLAGFPKDVYYMYQSEWTNKPVLHLLPHWNWKEGQKVDVWTYYNQADEVELFVNGVSQGVKRKSQNEAHVSWPVVYKAGEIKAVSRKNGKVVLSKVIKTTGAANQLHLTAEENSIKADGKDLAFVTISVLDKQGLAVPDAMNNVYLSVEGGAEIVGVDNGYQANLQSFQAHHINLYNGKALVILKANKSGKATLKASAPGLQTATFNIDLTK